MPPRSLCPGFTLPELLVVLAIAGILLAAGLPGFRHLMHNQQVATAAGEFLAALHLTRSEAIQRGRRVDLAPRDSINWENGWVVFVNKDGDTNLMFDAGDLLINSHDPLPSGIRVTTTLSDKSAAYIAYNGSGRPRSNLSERTPQWGSWQFSRNGATRLVRLGLLGRARICNPASDKTCTFSADAAPETD